ncbi:MAG: hypothetical protein ACAH83_00820 [Alphaproteobacteria bacterium]
MSKPEKSAEKQPSARLDFKKAARDLLRDHPETAGRLLIIDPETRERHGTPVARLRGRTNKLFRTHLKESFKKAKETTGAIADVIRLGSVSAVVLTAGRETPEKALFDLHRQAGRLLVTRTGTHIRYFQSLFGSPYAAENAAADVYAAVRHLRQGENCDLIERVSRERAVDFLRTGEPEHLTSFALDKVRCGGKAFTALKADEVVEAVQKIVTAHTPSRADSDALVKEFAALKGKPLDEAGLKLLADIAQTSKNPLVKELAGYLVPEAPVAVPLPAQKQKPPQP